MPLTYRGEPYEHSLIHTVESVVVEWSHQIQDVLKKSSAQLLLQGKDPGPLVEIDFWASRRADLESILDQLCDVKVSEHACIYGGTSKLCLLPPCVCRC